jgi:hypothetical protein
MERKLHALSRHADIKHLIIGFLLGVCLMLVTAATESSDADVGTYQCCAAGDDPLAVFVIDTQTGQAWRLGRTEAYDFGTPGNPKSVRRSVTPYAD